MEIQNRLGEERMIEAVIEGWEDFFRNMTVYSPSPLASFQKIQTRAVYLSGADFPLYNGVLEKNLDEEIAQEDLESVLVYFKNQQIPFCWWTDSPPLEDKGFKLGGVMKGVALDLSKVVINALTIPTRWTIKIVEDEGELAEFCHLSTVIPGMSSQMSKHYENVCGQTMRNQEQLHFLSYLDDKPVATLTLTLSHRSAGIWNAATLPAYRKMGIFTTLLHTALLEAKRRGYQLATALLMPKGMAWSVFQKFGFQEVYNFPFYLYGFDPNSLE